MKQSNSRRFCNCDCVCSDNSIETVDRGVIAQYVEQSDYTSDANPDEY